MRLKLRGRVARGQAVSAGFTGLPWVRGQFIARLGIDPYPGTFNVEVAPEDMDQLSLLRSSPGIEISPEQPGFCVASGFQAVVGGTVKAAVIVPCVSDYPANKLELISAVRIREALSLKEGDPVSVEVTLPE